LADRSGRVAQEGLFAGRRVIDAVGVVETRLGLGWRRIMFGVPMKGRAIVDRDLAGRRGCRGGPPIACLEDLVEVHGKREPAIHPVSPSPPRRSVGFGPQSSKNEELGRRQV